MSASRPPIPAAVHSDAVLPAVTGVVGQEAAITIPKAKPSGKFVVSALAEGRGRKAQNGDIVIIDYSAKSWKSKKALPGTYDKGDAPKVFPVGKGAVIPALDRAVQGQQAGSRLLVVAPPTAAYGTSGNARLGVSATETVVFVVDVVKVLAADAIVSGEQRTVPEELPEAQVGRSAAVIAVPDTAAPGRLVSRTLVSGPGPKVKTGRTVVLQYSGAVWEGNRGKDRATLFESSWAQRHPTTLIIGVGNVIEGWDKALVGAKVGSRVLLVVPPRLGYGAQARKGIPARSTLVYVVDILAAA
ncbi:FKBP-type peptidyl-prolyl cis-trans isomerase [Streptomyces sp. AC555_RSS877]|uniref:FKBP-type peptidyl-prolyl cis-trans isomerase n=1 Tax=Streptomyces sp. AC555_RSS877 TaxID=2823688 RepID=UPI001C26A071|nr:FKBP-type peptidyl-prolyl cis-trans isomerase [Streptomyces sp. AC555_RSS877]